MSRTKKSSDSYLRIWKTVSKIPKGRVSTYGAIADECGLWGQARLVGYALHNLPQGSDVPWQRVINSQGKISEREGAERQRELLEGEGVVFVKDKVDLKKYGWGGPGEADEPRQEKLF